MQNDQPHAFKHAFTRDVAYAGILRARRRPIHRAVANAIENLLGTEGFEAMLGYHREQAGQRKMARAAYLAGARASVKKYANEEAARLYRHYIGLVKAPSEESILARKELARDVPR